MISRLVFFSLISPHNGPCRRLFGEALEKHDREVHGNRLPANGVRLHSQDAVLGMVSSEWYLQDTFEEADENATLSARLL